ncbi:MAG: GntR family transcriptional regulator [Solirubrobacterales bacterium]
MKLAQQSEPARHGPFATEQGSEVPVGAQLSWRLRALILSGRLATGEALPSVRRMAGWANVNANTVRAVYKSLEEAGLVESRQGRGTFVTARAEVEPRLEAIAVEALRRGREEGVDLHELAKVIIACEAMGGWEEGPVAGSGSPAQERRADAFETLEVRQELRRQIARLEAELAGYVRDLPDGPPTAPLRAEAHVAGVEELERTRDALITKLSAAQRAAEQRAKKEGEEQARRRAMAERTAAASSGAAVSSSPLLRAMNWWQERS